MSGPSGTMRNVEGSSLYPTGTFRTFNDKIIRFRDTNQKSIYIGPQGTDGPQYNLVPENTDATLWNAYFTNPINQIPFKWVTEEVIYKTSDIDVQNGIWDFYKNGVLASNKKFKLRTSAAPEKYNIVYQSQVSNGAQPGSNIYYDTLYIDDSWHHVVICSSATWSGCIDKEIQIPTNWSDNQVTIQVNTGGLNLTRPTYLYVIDKDGNANDQGYLLCLKCPLPPTPN